MNNESKIYKIVKALFQEKPQETNVKFFEGEIIHEIDLSEFKSGLENLISKIVLPTLSNNNDKN